MLTTATLAELKSGVHLSYFSRSIQDAIKVVAGLGFEYLWVGAICILQDDPNDMIAEIKIMGDIYHNASFTIAALNTVTNQKGFLTVEPLDAYPVTFSDEDGNTTALMMVPDSSQRELAHPIYARVWTLQEG